MCFSCSFPLCYLRKRHPRPAKIKSNIQHSIIHMEHCTQSQAQWPHHSFVTFTSTIPWLNLIGCSTADNIHISCRWDTQGYFGQNQRAPATSLSLKWHQTSCGAVVLLDNSTSKLNYLKSHQKNPVWWAYQGQGCCSDPSLPIYNRNTQHPSIYFLYLLIPIQGHGGGGKAGKHPREPATPTDTHQQFVIFSAVKVNVIITC